MASPNPFSSSPYAQLAAEQDELARVQQPAPATPAAMPDATSAQPTPAAAQPVAQPEAAPAPHRRADNYLPPADLRGVFDASAQEYGVPVNALMALAHQESRYNPNAVGSETQWGRAKGIMQYLDGTAKGLGINPFDPNEAIPAAAKQLRERLDQGYSLEDAVKEHFAGPDRKKWGVKTAAYGQEVMGKVGRIGDVLMGEPASASANTNAGPDLAALQQQLDADEPGRYKVLPAGYDLTHFTTAMPRDVYQQTFMETNPGASPAAVDYAMGQYDQQAQQRAAQTPAADRFKTLQSPEATFDARLNKKLQGAPNGVVPPLPGKMEGQPAAPVPEFDAAAANRESTLDAAASYLGKSLKSGMYDLAGAGAKVLDEINPWTLTPSDAAVLFKNDPAKLKQFQDDSAAMVLSRFANSMTKGSEQAMTEVSPRAKRDYGSLEYATTDLSKAAYTSPTKVIGDVVRSLPTTVAMALSVYLTRGAAARAEQTALAAGMTPEMARQAAVAAGAKTMATAGAASEGVTGYAQQANQSASDAAKVPMTELAKSPKFQQLLQQGFTPETARAKIIADTGEQAGQIAGIVDAAVNHVGGEFLGKILTEGGKLIPRIMKGAANEAATEFVQSGGEQAGQNVATRQNINPNQSLTEGVGEAAVAGGVAGAVMGGVASGAGGQGHVAAQPAPAAEAPAAAPRPLPASQVQPVPSSAVPAAPSATPLTSAVENAAAQPQRVVVTNAEGTSATGTVQHYQETKDGGFEAAIVGDDGQVYTITDEDGVQLTPVANEPGPLTAAVEAAAEHHAVAPEVPDAQAHAEIAEAQPVAQPEAAQEVQQQAATPAEPEPAPAPRAEPPKPVDLTDAQLRERLQNIASQAKGAGRDQRFIAARREVEAEINRRAKAQEAANAPQVSDTGGNVGGRSDSAAARNGTDLGGRPGADRPLPGNGSTDAGLDAGQAAADRPAASAAADAQPALRDKHAKQIFPTEDQASAYLAKQKIGATHRVEQTGRVRYEIRPKVKPAVDWQGKVDKQQAALEAQIAVANASAAARKTAASPSALLRSATRKSNIKGMEGTVFPDPVAQDILAATGADKLDAELAKHGAKTTSVIGAGTGSVVLDAGKNVVRLGLGAATEIPNIEGVLQPVKSGSVGNIRFDIMPKADTKGITDADVEEVRKTLAAQGYDFSDAGTDNVGKIDGKPVVIDPGAFQKVPEVAPAKAAPPASRGHATSLRINNEKVGAHWEVVEAKDLNATIGKAENQYRDRTRAASQAQIGQIANAPAFDMLADSPVMDYGAPTLAKDGKTIIGGNGRFAGLVRAYEQGTADDYRAELEANAQRYGVSTEGMKQPVLVRRFADDVNIKEAAIASNEGGGLKMSALEQAKVDAERMGDMADFIVGDNGDVNNASNQRFIRSFMGRMPQNQQASFVDADGKLSQEGIQRIRNAVLFRAYGDSPTLTRMVESADPGLRNVVTALLRVAPKIADVKARIADGDLHDLDISSDLIAAVEQLNKLRSEGTTIDDYINQLGLFGDTVSDEVASILRYMDANTRSAKAIADFLGAYYDGVLAVGSPKQNNMFGAAAVPTRQEIINEKAKRQAGDAAKQNDIFAHQDAGGKSEGQSQGARTAEASDGGQEVAARYSVKGDADQRDLIITHNLTERNILHAHKMGGIPVPSLAVTRKDAPLTNFGEITLIGSKAMADPKGYAKTQVFGSDIYSPRYPSVEREIDRKASAALDAKFRPMAERMGASLPGTSELERDGQREMERNMAVMGTFLAEQGVAPTIVMRDGGLDAGRVARLKQFGLGPYLNKTSIFDLTGDPEFVRRAADEAIDAYRSSGDERLVKRGDRLAQDEEAQQNIARDLAYKIIADAKQRLRPEADKYRTQQAMEKQIADADLAEEFQQYVNDELGKITKSERIFQGFTNSGNRKYTPHTLENVVKILKKELRGGESFHYGVGSLRAHFTPQFKTIAQMKKEKGRLVSHEQFEKVRDEINAEFDRVSAAIGADRPSETIIAILEDAPKMGLERAAKQFGIELSPEAKQQAAEFLTRLHHLPTEYFEAKILRDVSLSEFSGAVIPKATSKAVRQALEKHGIPVREYESETDRAQAIDSFAQELDSTKGDILYSVKGGVPQAEFGPVHTEYRNDVAGAVSRLMADKDGEAIVHRADLGDISLVYGDEQAGLEHIARRRGTDFMDRLPGLLKDGLLYSKPGQKDRVFLGTDSDEAVLRLQWDGKAKTWLLSAYEKYPDLKPASEVEQSRRSQTVDERSAKVMDTNDLRRAVTQGVLGKVIGSMIDAGVVVLHDKPSQLPRELGTNVKGVQAVTTPDGKIHLVASNLTPQNARAVMLHEAFHEGTEKLLGQEKWAKLMGRAGSLYRQAEGSSGRAREVFDRARARVAAAKAKGAVPTRLEVEEFAAYTIEEYERAPDSLPAAMRKWVEDLIGTVKAWLVKRFDKQLGEVTPAQLAAYAKWAVLDHAAARRGEIFGDKGTWFSVAANVTDTPAFKKWFAKSQVVDENGQPLVVYHGTNTDFTTFKPGSTEWTNGIFFTDSQRVAADVYAGGKDQFNAEGLRAKLGAMSDAEIEKVMERARNTVRGFDYYEDFSDDYVDVRKDFVDYLGSEFDPAEGLGQKVDRVMDEFGVAPRAAAAGANVIPAYVSLKNPLVIDAKGDAFDHEQQSEWFRKAKAGGHDGIIIKNYEDGGFGSADTFSSAGKHTVYVAFKPEQVKSAIGNNSDFDPANPDIRYSVNAAAEGAPGADVANAEPDSLIPPEQGVLRRLQGALQDNMNRVRQVQDRIEQVLGRALTERSDYYAAETNRPGRIAARLEDVKTERWEPLMRRLAKSGHTQAELESLLHAMHAEERNAAVARINPDMPDGGSGMTSDDAQAIIAQHKSDAELHAIAQQARDIARATLDLKLAYGLITKENYDTYASKYDNYVPLKGDGEFGPKIKRAMGHDEREEHVLDNIARDYDQAVVVGEKNLARQSLLRMVLQNMDPRLWTVGVPPKGRYVAGKVYAVMKGNEKVAAFTSQSQVTAFLEGKGNTAGAYRVVDSAGEQVVEFTKPLQDNEIIVYVKGDPVRIQIHGDEALARQLRPLKQDQMGVILEKLRGINRYLSKIYTGYNPAFILRNAARDALTGSINMVGHQGAATAAKAWARYPAAVLALGKWAATGKIPAGDMGKLLTEYRAHGGKVGASYMSDLEQQGKTLQRLFDDAYGATAYAKDGRPTKAAQVAGRKIVGAMAHVIEVGNQATENGLRLALYAQLRAEGATPGAAARAAKTVTVDFDRKGTQTGALGALYLFFNPAVQGAANAIKTLAQGEHKTQAWAALGGLALLGMYAAGKGMDDDKDRWLGEGWDVRSKNFMLNIGGKQLRIPLSQEFAPAYAFGAALAEAGRGEKKSASAMRMLSSFLDAYFPMKVFKEESDNRALDAAIGMTPTVGLPLFQSAVNRSTFGSEIVPDSELTKDRPDNLKMFRGTKNSAYDKAAQGIASIGELLGAGKYENDISKVSPETLKLVWRTYTGGLGQFVTDSVGLASMAANDKGQLETGDVPIVKDFVKTPDVKPIRARYYDMSREAKAAITEFQQARKAGDAEAVEKIVSDPAKAQVLGLSRMVTKVNKATASIRDAEVDVNQSTTLTPSEKRAELKKLEQQEEDLYRLAIGAFK